MQATEVKYRQKIMRFARFEDFIKELMLQVEDPNALKTIQKEFAKERERVKEEMQDK